MGRLVVDGREFKSVREACLKYNAGYIKVINRMKKGMSLEEAIKTEGRIDFGAREIEVFGVKFSSKKDACQYYNVNYHNVVRRTKSGESLNDVLASEIARKKRDGFIVNGVKYKTIVEACEKCNAKYSTVVTRMRYGMSLEDAINMKKDGRAKEVVVEGIKFDSVSEACKHFGVDYSYVRYQRSKGLSLEDAIKVVKDKYGYMFGNHSY